MIFSSSACGLGARVYLLDTNLERLRYLSDVRPPNCFPVVSSPANIRKYLQEADLVVGAVLIPGATAPRLVTRDMLSGMRPGSVIVDMAAETGGNVEGSVAGETVIVNGVTIIGDGNWANYVARDASQMYAANPCSLIEEVWHKDEKRLVLNFEDDIIQGCVITHEGMIVNQTIKNLKR